MIHEDSSSNNSVHFNLYWCLSIWLNDEWSLSKSDIAVSFAQKKNHDSQSWVKKLLLEVIMIRKSPIEN